MNIELASLLTEEIRMASDWARSEHSLRLQCVVSPFAGIHACVDFLVIGSGRNTTCFRAYPSSDLACVRKDFRDTVKSVVEWHLVLSQP